ncbi:uncharacterized protein FTOL_07998 [Fusarium torulosum]|uniref:Uncharacterized protein n=1 Tax=Fusarium torulosum TaxID=33205 RepID=A0AAE8MCG7_9HYPO|nr:uncharacterized protein FTOL_07998 [Fusarium torulosum]
MTPFRPHPLPFTSKDPRMQDPKGENVGPGNNGLSQFSDTIFSCPVVVATEPAYALARQVKKMREKRADKKAAEKERSPENAEKEKWHGKEDEYDESDSRDKSTAPSSEMERMNKDKHVESWSKLRVCTPECPAYHKDRRLAHDTKQPQEPISSGASID